MIDQFLYLLTPLAIATAVASGIAFAVVIQEVRPGVDHRLKTFLALLLGVLWYAPQAVQLGITNLLEPDTPAAVGHAGPLGALHLRLRRPHVGGAAMEAQAMIRIAYYVADTGRLPCDHRWMAPYPCHEPCRCEKWRPA